MAAYNECTGSSEGITTFILVVIIVSIIIIIICGDIVSSYHDNK
jgi:hypothetical protein